MKLSARRHIERGVRQARQRVRIPFYSQTVLGLYLSSSGVTGVALQCSGARIDDVQVYEEQVGDHGDLDTCLQRLAARLDGQHACVVGHLDAAHVRYRLAEGPAFEDWEVFEAWLQAEAARLLPAGSSADDFTLRYHVLSATEATTRCFVALAHEQATQARHARLQAAGFAPDALCCAATALALAWPLHRARGEAAQRVLLYVDHTAAMWLRAGPDALDSLSTTPHAATTWPELAAALQTQEASHQQGSTGLACLDAVGFPPVADVAHQADDGSLALLAQAPPARLSIPSGDQQTALEGRAAIAGALALQVVHADRPALNFLPAHEAEASRQHRERAEAFRLTAWVWGLLLTVVLGATWAASATEVRMQEAAVAVDAVAAQLAEIEQAREELQRLRMEVRQAEHLVGERTHTSTVLAWIGRIVPEAVWLYDVALLPASESALSGTTHISFRIRGATLDEAAIATYMDGLGQAPFVHHVGLAFSEQLPLDRLSLPSSALRVLPSSRSRVAMRFEMLVEVDVARASPALPAGAWADEPEADDSVRYAPTSAATALPSLPSHE